MHTVSDETADVVDVINVNIVILSVGCLGVCEAARGKQLIATRDKSVWAFAPRARKVGSPRK